MHLEQRLTPSFLTCHDDFPGFLLSLGSVNTPDTGSRLVLESSGSSMSKRSKGNAVSLRVCLSVCLRRGRQIRWRGVEYVQKKPHWLRGEIALKYPEGFSPQIQEVGVLDSQPAPPPLKDGREAGFRLQGAHIRMTPLRPDLVRALLPAAYVARRVALTRRRERGLALLNAAASCAFLPHGMNHVRHLLTLCGFQELPPI